MYAAVKVTEMRRLADFLETIPPEDFALDRWREREPRAAIALGPLVFRAGCGFAGCAMGWAAHAEVFPGLSINRNGVLVYKGATEFDAAARVLGVTENQAIYFFAVGSYEYHADPAHVADRLRRFAEIVERRAARAGRRGIRLVPGAAA
jgi:hypothetical protein